MRKGYVLMTEHQWDKRLKIQTAGRDDTNADEHNHPYEPTPYCVLERLVESGYITAENTLVDYGSGKGRVSFFLSRATGCKAVGIEHDEHIWRQAIENLDKNRTQNVTFLLQKAEEYSCDGADVFYFFNSFTVEILKAVLDRIMDSFYDAPRRMRLIFYYPHDDYLSVLLTGSVSDEIWFLDEIDCRDLFSKSGSRERIMIFEITR